MRSGGYTKGRLARFVLRLRHRRGHGVHSPYVYSIVREVFMRSAKGAPPTSELYTTLRGMGLKERYSREIDSLSRHCALTSFSLDEVRDSELVVCSVSLAIEHIESIVAQCRERGAVVVILWSRNTPQREKMCDRIIAEHRSTTILRAGYLVLFNNHLPKQHFIL